MWNTENEHALHLLKNTIGDAKLIHVVGAETAAQAWKQLAEVKEPRGLTAIVNTTWKLYTTRCLETGSVTDHIAKLHGIMSDCQTLGESISDWTFATIITKSLLLSWDLWVLHSGQAKQLPTKIEFNPPMSFPGSSKKNNSATSIRSNKTKWQTLPNRITLCTD